MDQDIKLQLSHFTPKDPAADPVAPKRRPRHRLSCAECRRLKLKCDRVWPCSSCTKRGCARICPDGTLQAKIRSKDTSVLVAKIAELENLLREKDLRLFKETRDLPTSSGSSSSLGLSGRKSPNQTENSSTSAPLDPSVLSLIDGIGTLNLSGDGRSRFLGLSASSALFDGDCSDSESVFSSSATSEAPDEIIEKYSTLKLFASTDRGPFDANQLKTVLPDRREAERLGNVYHNFVYHIYGLNSPNEFHELLEEIYNDQGHEVCMTRVALLFSIFSLGVLFDPEVQALHADVRKWYEAAEAALMSTDYLASPTLSSVQAIHLMGICVLNSRVDATEAYWPIVGIALRLCQSMGLHRDGSNWGLEASELESRRRIFHELLSLDRLQSLILGRPYAISDKHFDTQIPEPSAGSDLTSAQVVDQFSVFKWKFSSCIGHVVDDAFSISPPSLAVVNRLDQEIRSFDSSLPSYLRFPLIPPISEDPKWPEQRSANLNFVVLRPIDLKSTMQQHFMAMVENQTLLFLHRRAFALALSEPGSEPLRSKFGRSVLSVITESAHNLVTIASAAQTSYPELANRWWHLFSNAYSGATCVATLLIKSPRCGLAKQAWSTLETAMSVFATAAQHGPLCKDLLTRLTRLRRQALAHFQVFNGGTLSTHARRLSSNSHCHSQGLRSLNLRTADDSSTPLSNLLDLASQNASHLDLKADIPCELGASTRLTRKNRTQSVSNSSIASGRRQSAGSSSRSRVTSFGSSGPNDLSFSALRNRGSSNIPPSNSTSPLGNCGNNSSSSGALAMHHGGSSWGRIARTQSDEFDEENNGSSYWENLSVEPTNEPYTSPIFGMTQSHNMHYFGTFPEHFHPPMVLPSDQLMFPPNNSGGGFGIYGPPASSAFETSPRLQPTSPPLPPMNSNVSNGADGNPNRDGLTSPTNTQFDLLDTFLTW